MSSAIKTIVATGTSSGLGFEAVKQLLLQSEPYRFILGARDTLSAQAAYDALSYDSKTHSLTVLPLELSDLRSVRKFSQDTLKELGETRLDYLLLNAAMTRTAKGPGPHGSKWCDAFVVNHLSQHYLIHLLKEKIVSSSSRVVVVSSGAARMVKETGSLVSKLTADSGAEDVYPASKFTQLTNALYWRRQLKGQAEVVAVSPGLIPGTGLGRHTPGFKLTMDMPDAKPMSTGAASILRALTRSDFPADPNSIFLTSWGDWWDANEMYPLALDEALQNKFSPSKEEIEADI